MKIIDIVTTILSNGDAPRRVLSLVDAVWGYVCLFSVPVGAGIVIYWSAQAPALDAVVAGGESGQPRVYEMDSNESLFVDSPLQFAPTIEHVAYRAHLVDSEGEVAYSYPEVIVSKSSGFRASDFSLKVPNGLPDGTYYLNVEAIYPLNPIKTASLHLEIAKINIGQPDDSFFLQLSPDLHPFVHKYRYSPNIGHSIDERANTKDAGSAVEDVQNEGR